MLGCVVQKRVLLQLCLKLLITRAVATLESAKRKVSKACSSDVQLAAWVPYISNPLKVLLCSVVHKTDNGALLVDNNKTSTYGHQVHRSEYILWIYPVFTGFYCQGAADLIGSKRALGECDPRQSPSSHFAVSF